MAYVELSTQVSTTPNEIFVFFVPQRALRSPRRRARFRGRPKSSHHRKIAKLRANANRGHHRLPMGRSSGMAISGFLRYPRNATLGPSTGRKRNQSNHGRRLHHAHHARKNLRPLRNQTRRCGAQPLLALPPETSRRARREVKRTPRAREPRFSLGPRASLRQIRAPKLQPPAKTSSFPPAKAASRQDSKQSSASRPSQSSHSLPPPPA
jgi:hypothetical protein